MERSYIEYSRIVESFISQGDESFTQTADLNEAQSNIDQRMKLAFLNVLREEMTE
jgi:hypothetical protein